MDAVKQHILQQLRKEVLTLSGYKKKEAATNLTGLSAITSSFPNNRFPLGAIHEFISTSYEQTGVTSSFIAGILKSFASINGTVIWINTNGNVFPHGLQSAGLNPHQVIFITLKSEKEALWVFEESLKCEGLVAVIAEISNPDFTSTRRFQLVVEKSLVTGFIIRNKVYASATLTRWSVTSAPGLVNDLPGVGFPIWKVDLLKVRNGQPASWFIYSYNGILTIQHENEEVPVTRKKAS